MLARGFKVDTRAVTVRCTVPQANSGSCPEGSSIGRGHTEVTLSGYLEPDDSADVITRVDAYLAPAPERGDAAGMIFQLTELISKQRSLHHGPHRSRRRRAPSATSCAWTPLPQGQPPPPVTATFKRLRLFLQARRKVVKTVRKKRPEGQEAGALPPLPQPEDAVPARGHTSSASASRAARSAARARPAAANTKRTTPKGGAADHRVSMRTLNPAARTVSTTSWPCSGPRVCRVRWMAVSRM